MTSIFSYFDQATFLTLWAGAVFNTRPRCEDPLQGEGSTLLWCDVLSVTVGLVDIVVVAAIVVCFVYIKIKSMATKAVKAVKAVKEDVAAGVGAVELVEIVEQTTEDAIYSEEGEEKKGTEFNNPMELCHRRHLTDDGVVYYENTKTGKTSWDMPPGLIEEEEETSETTSQ